MNREPKPVDGPVADAEVALARMELHNEAMQALLVRLLQDAVQARFSIDTPQSALVADVNEALILGALDRLAEAEVSTATLDALTRRPDRTKLLDRFSETIESSRRRGSRAALLILDLDDPNAPNDAPAVPFRDEVTQLAAGRMLAAVSEQDGASRRGGGEYVILLTELSQAREAKQIADELLASIGTRADADSQPLKLTASVGIAIYPDDGEDAATLVAHAEEAIGRSKRERSAPIGSHRNRPTSDAAPPPSSKVESNCALIHRRDKDLRDANERLILATLSAQELIEAADLARKRHAKFMAAVAEELSEPHAPVRVARAMLGELVADEPLLPQVQGIVEDQLAQVSRVLANLAEAPKQQLGGLAPCRGTVNLAEVIDAAVAGHEAIIAARAQHLEMACPPGRLDVRGDAALLEGIISNLLDNASKHTHDGGRIVLSVSLSEDTLTLTVSDNGIGITPALLPHIFAPFVQDVRALGIHGVGTGIGLTVVQNAVTAHGGTITVHSAGPMCGSRFVVALPRAAYVPETVAADPVSVQSSDGG